VPIRNFSLIYDDIQKPDTIRLSPVYDIISTLPYFKHATPALKMNGNKKQFPSQKELQRFGNKLGVKKTQETIEKFAQLITDTLSDHKELLEKSPQIANSIRSSISKCMSKTSK